MRSEITPPTIQLGNTFSVIHVSTQVSYFYQLMKSQDTTTWEPVGSPQVGDGNLGTFLIELGTDYQQFYRVDISN